MKFFTNVGTFREYNTSLPVGDYFCGIGVIDHCRFGDWINEERIVWINLPVFSMAYQVAWDEFRWSRAVLFYRGWKGFYIRWIEAPNYGDGVTERS